MHGKRRRGIGEIYAAIIIIMITIILGALVYDYITPRLVYLSIPKVSASIPSVKVFLTPSKKVIVEGVIKNDGSNSIRIEEVTINKSGVKITLTPMYPKTPVKPGEEINLLGFTSLPSSANLRYGESVLVIVKYCGVGGGCNYKSAITTVTPTSG